MSAPGKGDGYKVALFLTRNGGIAAEAFSGRWLTAASALTRPKGLRRHVHNAPAASEVPIENTPPAPFDAVDEFVFDNARCAAEWFGSTEFQESWIAARIALLSAPVLVVSGTMVNVWRGSGAASTDAVKILTLPVRRQGMTMTDFAHHWTVTHAGLALAGPDTRNHLLRLVSTPADGQAFAPFTAAPFDGIGIIEFDSQESLNTEFASDHYREVMAPDEPRFTDPAGSRAMMVRETVVFSAS